MDILKKTTSPQFEIVPRRVLEVSSVFTFQLKNEMTQKTQDILADVVFLSNENYQITMQSFPTSKIGDKFSYILLEGTEVVLMGKILIVGATENIQDYSKKSNNKFYK